MAHSQNPNHAKEDSLKVKDWYTKTYSDDELGEEINNDITFGSLWSHMSQGDNVYEILGVYDSVVRERVFEKLAEIRGVEYDVIYKQWLSSDKYARGGYVSKGEMVWNQLLSSKRADFLYKHFTPEITPRGQEILVGKTWNFLPRNVKNKLQSEYANLEEYADGGGVGVPKKPKYKIGQLVYSYQNKDTKYPINYIKEADDLGIIRYRLSLPNGNSNWINEESIYGDKYANGGALNSDEMDRYNELTQKMESYLEGGTKMSSKEIAEYSKLKHKRNMGSSEEYRKQMDWEKSVEGRYEYAEGGGVGIKERSERDSIKLAKAYQKVLDSNFADKEYDNYQKMVKETQIPKDELQKIEHYIATTPKGQQRMIDIYRYWGTQYANGGGVGDDLSIYVDRIEKIEYGVLEPNGHKVVYHLNQAMSSDDRDEMINHLSEARSLMPLNDKKYSHISAQILDIINDIDNDTDNEYAKGGGVGSSKTYKLRAEGLNDFLAFLQAGMYMRVKSFTVEPIGVPDVVVTFETDASLSEIKSKLREVPDSHVMLQTVKPINEYTGERDEEYARGGGVGEITPQLNKLVTKRAEEIYSQEKGKTKADFDKCFDKAIKEFGYEPNLYHKIMSEIGPEYDDSEYANGGGVGEYAESKFDSSVAKLREYIRKYPYIWTKNGKEYVPIEGWQFAGLILGYSTRVTEVTPTANGYMAKAEVVDAYNNIVCSGFGLVDKSESKWSGKPEYQLVGFAQTRAVSRALRNCLSWMVKAAGFNTTPAEEMYGVTPEKRGKMSGPRTFMPPMQSAKAEDTGFVFDRPEYQTVSPIEPVSAPMPKSENAGEIEETLRQMKAKAMANNIVIKSPDFMKEIDKALLGSDIDLQLSILKNSVMYMDENNIILQTPRYMSKLRKIANQEPF